MSEYPDCDPRFLALLAEFDGDALQNDGGTVYGLWPDLTLAYFNLGWMRFSLLNGGEPKVTSDWTLGRSVLDAYSPALRPFFAENFHRCLRERCPWEHDYECSSARLFRQFHMTTFPLGDAEGLLVVNSLRIETAHTRVACAAQDKLYRTEHGIVTQCSHCRRVRRLGPDQVWDWVPAWISTQPANTSHGLCEPCIGFHYGPKLYSGAGFAQSFTA